MDTENRRKTYQTPYVEGNVVRKLAPAPQYDREQIHKEKQEQEQEQQRRQQRKTKSLSKPHVGHGIDFISMLLLVVAIGLTLYVCVGYLQVQADITKTEMEISKLSTELEVLRASNNAFEESLDVQLDWDYIYQTAIGELGMVYPNKNHVITYEKNEDGYVRYYKDIPEQ